MTRVIRRALLSFRDLAVAAGPVALLAIALLLLAYWALDPNPPRRVVLVTGPPQSAFEAFGERYRTALARHGITLELRASGGSHANLRALREEDSGVSFGFVQGGTLSHEDAEEQGLVSLGSLFYEPVWIFHRPGRAVAGPGDGPIARLGDMRSWSVNVGTPDSGGPQLFNRLLQANRIDPKQMQLSTLGDTAAVVELLEGRLDAVMFASAPESPLIQMLLQTPGIELLDFPQAEAYARRFAFLSSVVLPRGIVEIDRDLPPRDVHLVATTSTLIAREDTHPALIQLMVQAAASIHGTPGWFRRAGEFPSARNSEIVVADEAKRFYRDGMPLLQRYLPFWVANLIDRMWVALAAIIAVVLPLSRVVPPIYAFRVRSRVFRWYGQLRRIEDDIAALGPPTGAGLHGGSAHDAESVQAKRERLRTDLDELDARVEHVNIPLSYADELYALRSHIGLVRSRLG